MRVYSHSYRDTMNLPMQVFWQLSGTVPRLLAGERRDHLEVVTTATDQEAAAEMFRNLGDLAVEPVVLSGKGKMVLNSDRDEEGFNELKSMAG